MPHARFPFIRYSLLALALPLFATQNSDRLQLFRALSPYSVSKNYFCFLRGQEGISTFPALLVVSHSNESYSGLIVKYEYIDLNNLDKKIATYIKNPKLFQSQTINCSNQILNIWKSIRIDFPNESQEFFSDDGTGIEYFLQKGVFQIYMFTEFGQNKQLDNLQRMIECEIERSNNTKWRHSLLEAP